MFIKIISAVTALSCAAGPAFALSCARPDPVAAFNAVAKADESFVILHGSFAFDAGKVPGAFEGPPAEVKVSSVFTGKLLTGAGFTDEVEAPVTITMSCAGAWCARMSPNTDYVAYVLQTEDELFFNVDPCYSFAFPNPEDATIKAVEQCAAGGDCTPKK